MFFFSDNVGAVRAPAILFSRIVNEGNYVIWQRALVDPKAEGVQYLLASAGDPIDKAIKTTMAPDLCLQPVNPLAINDPGEPKTFLYQLGNRTKQQGCASAQ